MKNILVLGCIVFILWHFFSSTKETIYEVKAGDTIASIAKDLEAQHIIRSKYGLIFLAKFKNTIPKVGVYDFKTINAFLENIHYSQVKTAFVTLIPGKTIAQYYQQLKHQKFINTTRNLEDIMQELGIQKPYEGRFLPQTYKVNYGDSAKSVFARSYAAMNAELNIFKKNNVIDSKYKLLILASMIEKESGY